MRPSRFLQSVFREGDAALCRPLRNLNHAFLVVPLKKDKVGHTHNGRFNHNDIIGRPKRIYLPFSKGKALEDPAADKFVVTEPTLDEYVSLCRRRAQPIYAMDAAVVALLGEIDPYGPKEEGPRRYLEAGTGNGSLTLAICQLLHGANAVARHFEDPSLRGAILHSVDRNKIHQENGALNVANYKRGRYAGDVEFGLAELPLEWVKQYPGQLTLHGVFLDLPDPHLYLGDLAKVLALEATLVVFCPSITQLLKCKQYLVDKHNAGEKVDLSFVRAMELPPGNGGGTREWDISSVVAKSTGERVDICRPKVGERVVGGGFIGVFKRKSVDGTLY